MRFGSESVVLVSHPALRNSRRLVPADLEPFSLISSAEASGPIADQQLAMGDGEVYEELAPPIDRQLERVTQQQFIRFAVVRRDVSYEMCGTTGTVSLTGHSLLGATTPEATRPIVRRLVLWAVAAIALVVCGSAYAAAWSGSTRYFDDTNSRVSSLVVFGTIAAILATGGMLRGWRPKMRAWPLRGIDRGAVLATALAVLACPLVRFAGRPRIDEASVAITRGDLTRARLITEALQSSGASAEVNALTDTLEWTEAGGLSGDARLAKLDSIAGRSGTRATDARAQATSQRIATVTQLLDAHRPTDALTRLDGWAGALPNIVDVAELRAKALEQQGGACDSDPCRFVALVAAKTARSTAEREAAVVATRTRLTAALDARPSPVSDAVVQVHRLRDTTLLADSVLAVAASDVQLATSARAAAEWADGARSRIVLLGAPVAAIDDLLGRGANSHGETTWPGFDGVAVFAASSAGVCTGLYVTGASAGSRALTGHEDGLQQLLARASGQPAAALHLRTETTPQHAVTHWAEGHVPITARWNTTTLMELRIGNAAP